VRLLIAGIVTSLLLVPVTTTANSAPQLLDKKFSNCAALNKVYPGGVAKAKNWVNKGGKIQNTPAINAKVYAENSSKDRDKDGIACEN
jgi:Excalibur calcium-binding domain